jgi:hypothetical protein
MAQNTVSTEVTANTTITTTAETVVATLSGVSTSGPGRKIQLKGEAKITTGASTTALNLRIRRDSLTGTVVDESNIVQIEAAAGSTEDHDISCEDIPAGEIFNATYVLTVQGTASSADNTCVYAYLEATTS